jgi:hypothetical protein
VSHFHIVMLNVVMLSVVAPSLLVNVSYVHPTPIFETKARALPFEFSSQER